MKLSIAIPAYNEAPSIGDTINGLDAAMQREQIDYEILVVNDNSKDNALKVLESLQAANPRLRYVTYSGAQWVLIRIAVWTGALYRGW